jgi:hypothetical protein
MNKFAQLGDAGDDFLDRVCPGDWLSTAFSHSKAKRFAARIVPATLWLLWCVYAFAYFFIGSLPQFWHDGMAKYFVAAVFVTIYAAFLLVLLALVASVATCASRKIIRQKQGETTSNTSVSVI